MGGKTFDLERIRRAHARLDAYLKDHPEMRGESSEAEWLEIIKEILLSKEVFSVKDVAELLSVEEETVRRAIRKKALRAAKIGKDYRISRLDLETYYREQGGGALFGLPEVSEKTDPEESNEW